MSGYAGGGDGWWFLMTVSDNDFLTQDVKLQVIHFSGFCFLDLGRELEEANLLLPAQHRMAPRPEHR